jgi:hypothetical protein
MVGRGTEFDVDAYGLRSFAGEATGALVRPLGAFERMYHRRQQISTMHFCVVAELADDLNPGALARALRAVQHRHPLLNVYVDDDPQAGPGFCRPTIVPPIPVTVIDETDYTWCDVVADELTRPFDAAIAPMVRVVLLRSTPAAIILTVDHAIVDGISAAHILRDLFSALNGNQLQALPVPPSQEELIGRLRAAQPAAALAANGSPPAQPDWFATPSTVRAFDGAVPHLSAICFDEDLTRRLVARARAERTTVHSALVAAMSRAILESGRNEFVRMLTPYDFRAQIGVHDDVCLYFTAARTAFTRDQLTDPWDMARTVGDQLAVARSVPALLGGSAAIEQFIPIDVTPEDADAFMTRGLSFEAFASNLRVLDMGPPEAVRPVAIWGPAILVQVQGELACGVCTFNGQLRIVSASHDPLPGYLERVRDVIDAAC